MFFDIFSCLCEQKGVSRYKACTDVGLNRAAVAKWKGGAIPNGSTLAKLAEYFGVSTDYLMGVTLDAQIFASEYWLRYLEAAYDFSNEGDREEIAQSIAVLQESIEDLRFIAQLSPQEKAPALTEKDERDIGKDLERIIEQLEAGGDLMFDGDPMSDEARESIKAAMKLGLEAAKLKNKERFTPKQYRKE